MNQTREGELVSLIHQVVTLLEPLRDGDVAHLLILVSRLARPVHKCQILEELSLLLYELGDFLFELENVALLEMLFNGIGLDLLEISGLALLYLLLLGGDHGLGFLHANSLVCKHRLVLLGHGR